jgi:hypothetical protein
LFTSPKLHIVAPEARKNKVFTEIQRPVFSLLEKAPLSECCSFISYDNLKKLAALPHLKHLSDSVLDEYSESAEESG